MTNDHDQMEVKVNGIAFALACVLLPYGILTGSDGYMASGAILYAGSTITSAIRGR